MEKAAGINRTNPCRGGVVAGDCPLGNWRSAGRATALALTALAQGAARAGCSSPFRWHPATPWPAHVFCWDLSKRPAAASSRWCLSKIRGLVDEPARRRVQEQGDTAGARYRRLFRGRAGHCGRGAEGFGHDCPGAAEGAGRPSSPAIFCRAMEIELQPGPSRMAWSPAPPPFSRPSRRAAGAPGRTLVRRRGPHLPRPMGPTRPVRSPSLTGPCWGRRWPRRNRIREAEGLVGVIATVRG